MKRFAFFGCLVVVSGLAHAQADPFEAGAFQNVFSVSGGRVFVISEFNRQLSAAQRQDVVPAIPFSHPYAMLQGDAPIITIEGDGVRMPDDQFTLPPEPAALSRR